MSEAVRNLEPRSVWNHFADLNAVPRASKKEERVIAFMKAFGESLGLETLVDHIGNVIIRKPATPGMEGRTPIVMQGHLDMVHQKNAATQFDFDTQGIDMFVEGDWVRANGTTLGADNGLGVAAIMAVLSAKDIAHPAIDALFTIDEETGMTGALELKGGLLNGKILLNLDTEEDHELTIGCAGGIDVTIEGTYAQEAAPAGTQAYRLSLKGLTGGHSGTEIHLGRGNANKLMNRVLHGAARRFDLRIARMDGGSLRNAIPREHFASVTVPAADAAAFLAYVQEMAATLTAEYATTDPGLQLLAEAESGITQVMDSRFQHLLLRSIYACPNGIYRMSPDIRDLVQTSNNLARVLVQEGTYRILCLTRSSVNSEKLDEADAVACAFELMGAKVSTSGSYPGWTPRPEAAIVRVMREIYQEMFQSEPHVNACHAGLECGILGTNYPEMEMISFGPTIRGAHSPDERACISSTQKFWKYLLETLKRIP